MDLSVIPEAEGSVEKFLHIPYDKRWEFLKDTMVRIYFEEQNKIATLARRMKEEYSFDAQGKQYLYHFKKWKIKKRITTEEKSAVISALGKRRLREGASTSDVTLDQGGFEKAVDKKQLKRYINQSIRQNESLTWSPGLFIQHALPYAVFHTSQHTSPPGAGPTTPQYLIINSPQENGSPSASQNNLTPTMQLVQKKVLLDRAKLFIEGRAQDLMAQMSSDEKKSTMTWLHDFWMYSFMTAKYWGKGPKTWSLGLIHFKSFAGNPAPSTPGHPIDQGQESELLSPGNRPLFNNPSQLCRWTIHYETHMTYERIPSPPLPREESEEQFDIDDETTWPQWPREEIDRGLSAKITQGLRENVFTAVQNEILPIAADSIVKTIEKSPEELEAEALGFAIISRNVVALGDILDPHIESGDWPTTFSIISPFHLAAQYLDGAKSCCLVMEMLVRCLGDENSIGVNYIDDSGHTVLDTLFITILKSHSTTQPHNLSDAFLGQSRYPGQEVDPCGRWDADSPCVRGLYASGAQIVPSGWKHMFCHTSVQAVCHCLTAMFGAPQRPNINTTSGLFTSRCPCCGIELKVGPLHAFILTAFYLASFGLPGETLFGMMSCLVCLLTYRADPCATSEISLPILFGLDIADGGCQHSQMNAAELASRAPTEILRAWTPELRQGWKALIAIIDHDIAIRTGQHMTSEHQTTQIDSDSDVDSGSDVDRSSTGTCTHIVHEEEGGAGIEVVYCGDPQLGLIWATVQAELVTYRRLTEHDPWLSIRFQMEHIMEWLRRDDETHLDRSTDGMHEGYDLNDYSTCGLFKAVDPGCARREEVCKSYYANLDDWKRTTFIDRRENPFD